MKKTILRRTSAVVLTVVLLFTAVFSVSMSASAAETTLTGTSATANASEYVFTDADLDEFRVKLNLYLESNDPKARETILGEYLIRQDYQKDLTHEELERLARQLDFYFTAKEFLKGGFGKWEDPGFLYDPPIKYVSFPPEVINRVVKFPKDIAIYKLPDEKHPKGLVIFRDCIPSNTNDTTLCQTAYDIVHGCFIQVQNSNFVKDIEDAHYYWICNWDLCDNTVAEYKQKYGENNWCRELSSDFDAVLCRVK